MLKGDRRALIEDLEPGETFFCGNTRGQRVRSSGARGGEAEYIDDGKLMIRVVVFDDYDVPSIMAYPEGWVVTIRP